MGSKRKPGPLWIAERTAAAPTTRRQLELELAKISRFQILCPLSPPAWVSGASTGVIENCLSISSLFFVVVGQVRLDRNTQKGEKRTAVGVRTTGYRMLLGTLVMPQVNKHRLWFFHEVG